MAVGHSALWLFAAVIALIEWLRAPSSGWALAAGATAAIGLAVGRRRSRAFAGFATGAAAACALVGTFAVRGIESRWADVQERRLTRASSQLGAALERVVADARRLVDQGAPAATLPRAAAFRRLALEVAAARYETGIVLYDSGGAPWAWAGRLRALPDAAGPPDAGRIGAFYATLESRRQTARGWAVVSVLVDADSLVADRGHALAAAFERRTGVRMRILPPAAAPLRTNVYDFELTDPETGAVRDTLLSVELTPPRQGEAKLATVERWSWWVVRLAAAALLLLGIGGPTIWPRLLAAAGLAWLAARAPLGEALFSPATFYNALLGPFSASAGALGALAAASCLGAIALWHRAPRVRWWSWPLAAALIVGTPFALRELGRGISPPATGAPLSLWLSWEISLTLVTAALVLTALALLREAESPARIPRRIWVGVGWAVVAGAAGIWLWEPRGNWPDWYGYSWLPAVALITVPAPRRAAAWATTIVAGTAAAVITWGAATEGRLGLAARDVDRLGNAGDPLAVAALERLGAQSPLVAPPRNAADLYRLWREAVPGGESYPAWLGAWRGDTLVAELPLAELQAPEALALEALQAPSGGVPRIETIRRVPGVHYLLVAPLAGVERLTVLVGPRSRLVSQEALVPFLRNEPGGGGGAYTLQLGLTVPNGDTTASLAWGREGWHAHGERGVAMPGGARSVHATVSLGSPGPTLARGVLLVLLDGVVLGALWLVVAAARGDLRARLHVRLAHALRSYRLRLAVALAAFVTLPTLAFALWSAGRLNDEVRRSRDLLVRQTLRDVAGAAGEMGALEASALAAPLEQVARRLGAELLLYRGPYLAEASAPVLTQLGLVSPLMPSDAFDALMLGSEVETAVDATVAGRVTRVGYRTVSGGRPEERAVLAAPQLLDDAALREEQLDLAYVLALVTILGLSASVWLAGLAARQLARPVAVLREAAVAVGRGEAAPALPATPPDEFRDVMAAFGTMAHDVRLSREQLDAARRRTARVLEHVATGVLAVTDDLTVTLANPRAEGLLGRSLERGAAADDGRAEWAPVWDAVRARVALPVTEAGLDSAAEFDVGGRRIRVQVARLADGAVVALDDATDLARAERVLAWGEMARQVAHEIKNPLTPLRLGVQHLTRIYRDQPERFPATFTETSRRLLAEITRLDAIARAFSRFGIPPSAAGPLAEVKVDDVAAEVVALYQLAGDDFACVLDGSTDGPLPARRDEVQEVLINLVENARNAGARRVTIRLARLAVAVSDDGRGIAPDLVDRIFEPRFSTTTSGAGLGLAIVRRIVESWGATVEAASTPGEGTTMTVRWPT